VTRLLASVASIDEAFLALQGGADLIDLKDPVGGALGPWPLPAIERAVCAVAGRRPLSATIGDGVADVGELAARTAATANAGVDFVKVGFFPGGDHRALTEALAGETGRGTRIVAVLFADYSADLSLLGRVADRGFAGAMLDTVDKRGTSLRQRLDDAQLGRFIDDARARGLLAGLAGSLSLADVEPLLRLSPDYLGFRGAVCEGGRRDGRLDPRRLAAIRALIPAAAAAPITALPRAAPLPSLARTAPPIP
jgi:dihydroneopterin aldolase